MTPNHSVLKRDTFIGDVALHCVTDDTTCCTEANGRGSWYYPNNNSIPSETGHTGAWYSSWQTGAVLLNYRGTGSGTSGITGLFRCEIRDSADTLHRLYTCIYDTEATLADCKFPALTHTLTMVAVHVHNVYMYVCSETAKQFVIDMMLAKIYKHDWWPNLQNQQLQYITCIYAVKPGPSYGIHDPVPVTYCSPSSITII